MTVSLDYYLYDQSTKLKTLISDALDMGSLFKGSESKTAIAIYNSGDETAIKPMVSVAEFMQQGANFKEAITWKSLSLDINAGYITSKLSLPDIPAKSWMSGKDIYFEDFSGYSTSSGSKPDQTWTLWEGNTYVWQIYAGYLLHNIDTAPSRAVWNVLPTAKDFTFSYKTTVRDGVYAGCILRDIGDSDTGYIVVVQGQPQYFTAGMSSGEGVVQVWKGKFSTGIQNCTLLYQSGSIGIRGTHDFFKIVLTGNKFEFYYGNELATVPNYAFIDTTNAYVNVSRPVLCCHAGTGSVLIYYDDIRMEIPTANGLVWIDNKVSNTTQVFGTQKSIFKMEFGGV